MKVVEHSAKKYRADSKSGMPDWQQMITVSTTRWHVCGSLHRARHREEDWVEGFARVSLHEKGKCMYSFKALCSSDSAIHVIKL